MPQLTNTSSLPPFLLHPFSPSPATPRFGDCSPLLSLGAPSPHSIDPRAECRKWRLERPLSPLIPARARLPACATIANPTTGHLVHSAFPHGEVLRAVEHLGLRDVPLLAQECRLLLLIGRCLLFEGRWETHRSTGAVGAAAGSVAVRDTVQDVKLLYGAKVQVFADLI